MVKRVPPIADVNAAVLKYYTTTLLNSKDICSIFGVSHSTALRLLHQTQEELSAKNIPIWNPRAVSTVAAYAEWGIDVPRLEKGLKKINDLGLWPERSKEHE